jgi:hypothetical protein
MGYTTKFTGELKFDRDITVPTLVYLKKFLGEDVRDHPEWHVFCEEASFNYIDLELLDDFSGLRWNGAEKSYDMVGQVNFILRALRNLNGKDGFGLVGRLEAQGEEIGDYWELVFNQQGWAERRGLALGGKLIECPDCGHKWLLKEANEPI